MTTYSRQEAQQVFVTVTDRIECNRCGATIPHDDALVADWIHVSKRWGFGSNNKDMTTHSFDLCERCYDAYVATFATPPKIIDHGGCAP